MNAPLTFADVLSENARSLPNHTAIVCGGIRLTYAQLNDRINRLANVMRSVGISKGDRVVWLGQNCHRLLEALLACAKLEAIFCPVNWRQAGPEIAFILEDAVPSLVLWQENEIGERVRAAMAVGAAGATCIQHDSTDGDSYEARLRQAPPNVPENGVDPDKPILMLYTAAFDGRPNGALLSQTGILMHNLVIGRAQDVTSTAIVLHSAPLFHIAGLYRLTTSVHMGATNVFTPRTDPVAVCELIDHERCTHAYLVEALIQAIIEANRDHQYNLKSLRALRGAPPWNEMITIDESPWGDLPSGYGQSEVSGMLTLASLGGTGTFGRTVPIAQVRIVDSQDREVASGDVGEIVARGPSVMLGYFNRPDLNERRFQNGWYRTNDLGRRESDGSITFVGSKQRLIKTGKENVYPAEVENCLRKHAAVEDCAVIGIADVKYEQSIKAVVVVRANMAASASELTEHCRQHLASYKKPKSFEFISSLPKNGQQTDYRALDKMFGGGGYPGETKPTGR